MSFKHVQQEILIFSVFSRLYCYTVWSAIDVIISFVCLTVYVTLCIVALRVGVQSYKICTSVFLAEKFLFFFIFLILLWTSVSEIKLWLIDLSLQKLCCSMYCFDTKRTEKTNWRTREREFLETDNQACTSCVTFCFHWLFELLNFGLSRSMVKLEQIECGCVHKLYPLNRIVPFVRTHRM